MGVFMNFLFIFGIPKHKEKNNYIVCHDYKKAK